MDEMIFDVILFLIYEMKCVRLNDFCVKVNLL